MQIAELEFRGEESWDISAVAVEDAVGKEVKVELKQCSNQIQTADKRVESRRASATANTPTLSVSLNLRKIP